MARAKVVIIAPNPWYESVYLYIKHPVSIAILIISLFTIYQIIIAIRRRRARNAQNLASSEQSAQIVLPTLRRDFTMQELREFSGQQDGRILIAVNSNVYDVSSAKRLYGSGGPYETFAFHDASRNLATFSVDNSGNDDYDDLWDLNESQLTFLREWDLQFKDKYPLVGKLLRQGETHTNYTEATVQGTL